MRAHLDIYVSKAFQWYKELFNPMIFDPCNHPLKFRKSIWTPIPKVGVHLGVWGFIPSHSLAFPRAWNVSQASFLARNFATLCLGHKPKVKVATILAHQVVFFMLLPLLFSHVVIHFLCYLFCKIFLTS